MKKLLLSTIMMTTVAIATAQIIHVPGDQPTIQAGIDAANFWNDTVLVDNGTYYENIDFSGKFITVASNYIMDGDTNHINNTIIDGSQPANPDYGSVVSFQTGEDTTSILCGFTITGGTGIWVPAENVRGAGGISIQNCGAKIMHNYIINNNVISSGIGSGGGIGVGDPDNNEHVVIRYNRISNNTIEASNLAEGGGIVIYCNGIITNNIVVNNTITSQNANAVGGGVRIYGYVGTRYINCSHNIISNNFVNSGSMTIYGGGGGMQAYDCFGNISNNTIQNNKIISALDGGGGGGLHFAYCGSSMILEKNLISKNIAGSSGYGGGIALYSSNIQMINNVIVRNYAEKGGGIHNHFNLDGPTQFINNTIAFNEGDGDGRAIYLEDADAVVLNSILWNFGDEIFVDGGSIEVAYSDIYDGWEGVENIDEDPDFIDDTCHLNCGTPSPCIDMGIVDYVFSGTKYNAPLYDFEGDERPMDVGFDMGADESKICVGIAEIFPSGNLFLKANPNPSSGALHLRYLIRETGDLKLEMYSANGLLVKTLMSGTQQPGEHELEINLSDLPNGLYLIRLQAGNRMETAKIILHK